MTVSSQQTDSASAAPPKVLSSDRGGWQAWLLDTANLRYGLLSVRILLVVVILIAVFPIEFSAGPRNANAATIFAWLPAGLLHNGMFFTLVRIGLVAAALMWWRRFWVPVSCWLTVLLGMLLWSLRMENLTNGAHVFNVTNMLLVIHAMWFQFYHREIDAGLSNQADDSNADVAFNADGEKLQRCYPRWVFLLSVFYLGWFHSLAGFTKILTSGFGWGNGVSLQLWTKLFGWEPSPFGQLLMYDARLTAWMQTGALLIECACILVIFNRWVRYGLGFGLFGFYMGVLTTFVSFGFHFNALSVVWFLLPVDWWFGLKFSGKT